MIPLHTLNLRTLNSQQYTFIGNLHKSRDDKTVSKTSLWPILYANMGSEHSFKLPHILCFKTRITERDTRLIIPWSNVISRVAPHKTSYEFQGVFHNILQSNTLIYLLLTFKTNWLVLRMGPTVSSKVNFEALCLVNT